MRMALALAALLLLGPAARAGNDPSGVVLLENLDSPDSVAIARHYVEKRGLARRQVVPLRVPVRPELTLAEYRASIEEPLRTHLLREGLEERARCLVLTRGIPVRVRTGGAFVSTAALLAAMDLPFAGMPQDGIPATPFDVLRAEQRANPFREGPFPEDRRPGGVALRLVTSLDGWSAEDAVALVDRSVAADAGPPVRSRFVFQDANRPADARNASYAPAAEALRRLSFDVEHRPAGKDAVRDLDALMGWISGGCYSALDAAGIQSNRFPPGAIADMLESFGAVPGNFDEKGNHSQVPVPLLVRAGVSGVHGAVAEPYSHTFPDARLFERYASGLDLAESFHASLPYLYWMNLVLGDPLCAPFARRPRVEFVGLPERFREAGPVTVKVRAGPVPGGEVPTLIALYADGLLVGSGPGPAAEFPLDPARFPEGPLALLAVARCEGPTRTRGWVARTATVAIPTERVVAWDPAPGARAVPPTGPFSISWEGRGAKPELLVVDAEGRSVPGNGVATFPERRVAFVPKEPLLPGRSYRMLVRGIEGVPPVTFTTGPAALEVAAPKETMAGEPIALRLGAAAPLQGERIEAWLESPPVLAASRDVPEDAAGEIEIPLTLTRAGTAKIRVRGRRSGATGNATVEVKPGPAASLFLLMGPKTPLGECFDIEVVVRDALGNAVPGWTERIALAAPTDPLARLPDPVAATGGRARFRGVAFGTAGVQSLHAISGNLQGADDTMVFETPILRWLLAGPFESEPPGESGSRRPVEGAVCVDRPWRAEHAPALLLDTEKRKGVLLAVTYLDFMQDGDAKFSFGHSGRLKAWLNGKLIYDGGAATKAMPERLAVSARVVRGPAALVLRLDMRGAGEDTFLVFVSMPGTIQPASRPMSADALCIAGTVRDAKGPMAGVEVVLSGARSRKTKTDAKGWYGFGDLKPGKYRVESKGTESRAVELADAEALGIDLAPR